MRSTYLSSHACYPAAAAAVVDLSLPLWLSFCYRLLRLRLSQSLASFLFPLCVPFCLSISVSIKPCVPSASISLPLPRSPCCSSYSLSLSVCRTVSVSPSLCMLLVQFPSLSLCCVSPSLSPVHLFPWSPVCIAHLQESNDKGDSYSDISEETEAPGEGRGSAAAGAGEGPCGCCSSFFFCRRNVQREVRQTYKQICKDTRRGRRRHRKRPGNSRQPAPPRLSPWPTNSSKCSR